MRLKDTLCVRAISVLAVFLQFASIYIPFAVFQRLANDKFCERNRCIVITVTPDPASSVIVT
jgi:DNA topoisomerase VI subunit A